MGEPLFHVDAFTERPFAGNPAAVCVLAKDRDAAWLSNVAREMNLPETAFLRGSGSSWKLRWFTPTVEVDLCGHATLASAHVLWEEGYAQRWTTLRFDTASGRLAATRREASGGAMIELDFPAEEPVAAEAPPELMSALGVPAARVVARNRLDYVVELDGEAAVRALAPDFARVAAACGPSRGVIVTARSERPEYDFVSRYFAPSVGIDEDPVTGAAHCGLGPYWSKRLGKLELTGYQASSRGGIVSVRVAGARVFLGGHAVTVARGELSELTELSAVGSQPSAG